MPAIKPTAELLYIYYKKINAALPKQSNNEKQKNFIFTNAEKEST